MPSDSGRSMGCNSARALALSLMIACVLGNARSTYAVLIIVNGHIQFYDDFEGVSPGSNPDTGKNRGHWAITGVQPVSNSAAPGPAQGMQYLSCTRSGKGEAGFWNESSACLQSMQSFDNLKIHAEWMMYVPSVTPATYRAAIRFEDDSDNIRTLLILGDGATGKVEYWRPDGNMKAAASTYTPDTWQKWTMDYTVGEPKFTFSIGNGPRETVDAHTVGAVAVMKFVGNHEVGSVFYVDAIEVEPASTGLLLTGEASEQGGVSNMPAVKESK